MQDYERIEVIVVDNASSDGSMKQIKANYGNKCKYIFNARNEGFSYGMNQGIESASGDYILPLNQDVCLEKYFVSRCLRRILLDDDLGAVGGRAYKWLGDELTSDLRNPKYEKTFLRKRFQGYGAGSSEDETMVFLPDGSFPFIRMKALHDIRETTGCYYDESFVTGWEDMDLFFRFQLRGWKCLFFPSAIGWHVGSGSVDGKDTFFSKTLDYRIRILRNRYYTILKNLPRNVFIWLMPYLFITELGLIPYFMLRSPKSLLALLAAWGQTFVNFPNIMKKRKLIQGNVVASPEYMKRFFVKF
jgi:GT2 family glycosyltransferase